MRESLHSGACHTRRVRDCVTLYWPLFSLQCDYTLTPGCGGLGRRGDDAVKRVVFHSVCKIRVLFTARSYASALLAMGLCLSVCPSVRHKSVFYRNGWTNRAGFWHVSFLPPVLHCVKKFGYLQNKGTSLWNFVLNSGLRKFRHGISIVETCYQLTCSSRKVDAQSVINWAVVGQLSR